jgi:DNA repair exonuclease SbcCD nuclease subunit
LPEEPRKCLLRREHVADCGLSYLALGDWHVFKRYFEDTMTVVQYSGSPETVQFDHEEQSGLVALVTFGARVPKVEAGRVGVYKWKGLEAQWETVGSVEDLKAQIAALADSNRVLRVIVRGTLAAKDPINWVRIREELEPKFAHLELDTSRLKAELPLEELQRTYRANTVEHAFVTLVEEALQKAQDPEEASRLREVLRRGHALFQGIEEVKS